MICYYDALDLAKPEKLFLTTRGNPVQELTKLNDEKTFIYLLNSSGWTLFIQILLFFKIMLNDISFFVFMLNMFLKLFCECLV